MKYFWDFAETNSGLARERYHPNDQFQDEHLFTMGGAGFGLISIIVGVERGFIQRLKEIQRINIIL